MHGYLAALREVIEYEAWPLPQASPNKPMFEQLLRCRHLWTDRQWVQKNAAPLDANDDMCQGCCQRHQVAHHSSPLAELHSMGLLTGSLVKKSVPHGTSVCGTKPGAIAATLGSCDLYITSSWHRVQGYLLTKYLDCANAAQHPSSERVSTCGLDRTQCSRFRSLKSIRIVSTVRYLNSVSHSTCFGVSRRRPGPRRRPSTSCCSVFAISLTCCPCDQETTKQDGERR